MDSNITDYQLLYLYETNLEKDTWWDRSGYRKNKGFFFLRNFVGGCSDRELKVVLEHVGSKITEAQDRHQRYRLRTDYSVLA